MYREFNDQDEHLNLHPVVISNALLMRFDSNPLPKRLMFESGSNLGVR